MAQQYAFLNFGNTVYTSVNTVPATITIGTSQTGLPATAARIWNAGTSIAYIKFGTATAISGSSDMVIPTSVAPFVLRTGGQSVVQLLGVSGTFTTTIAVTGGEGID